MSICIISDHINYAMTKFSAIFQHDYCLVNSNSEGRGGLQPPNTPLPGSAPDWIITASWHWGTIWYYIIALQKPLIKYHISICSWSLHITEFNLLDWNGFKKLIFCLVCPRALSWDLFCSCYTLTICLIPCKVICRWHFNIQKWKT